MGMICRPKEHVVARLVLLDHGVFEIERILFGGHNDVFHIGDSPDEEIGAERIVSAVEI